MDSIKKIKNKYNKIVSVFILSFMFLFLLFESCIASPKDFDDPDCFYRYLELYNFLHSTPEVEGIEKAIDENESLYFWLARNCENS